jgi:hypothetical protein
MPKPKISTAIAITHTRASPVAAIVADTARGIIDILIHTRDRCDQRRVLLAAYSSHLAAADRHDARTHETIRQVIALASQLAAQGDVETAAALVTHLIPLIDLPQPPALPPHLSGGA